MSKSKIEGKSFCFTGKASKPRKELYALVEKNGGVVKTNVSMGLDYLVIGKDAREEPSDKERQAQYRGTKIIPEDKFISMLKSKDTMPKTAKKSPKKPTKKTNNPPKPIAKRYDAIVDYYVSNEMWDAIDRSIYWHDLQPASQDAYHTIQMEAGKTWRMEEITDQVNATLERYFNTPMKDLEEEPSMEEAIFEIYADAADEVLHLYIDAEDVDDYLLPHNEETCPNCKKMREAQAKHEAALHAKAGENDDAEESPAEDKPEIKEVKPAHGGALGTVAMLGGMLLGAGLAHATKAEVPAARIVKDAVIDDVADVVVKESVVS
jgi:hypothetical protein